MPTGLMLIGNKQDLEDMNEREVSTETGETFAKVSTSPIVHTYTYPLLMHEYALLY